MRHGRPCRCFDGGSMGGYFEGYKTTDIHIFASEILWRRCHSQMAWQAIVALAFAANMYQWGIDNGEDCIKPKYRPVNLMNCK